MECPFELPVHKVIRRPYANPYIVDIEDKEICMCQDENEADYIVQAINSHEKLKELARLRAELLVCYRIGKHPVDELLDRLHELGKFEQALETEKE